MLTIWYYMIWYDVALPAIPKDERISVSHYSGEFRRYTPCSGNKNIIYMYLFTHKIIHIYIYDHMCIHVLFYILLQNLDKEGLQARHETYVSNWHPKNRSTPCKINQNNISQRLKAKPDLSQVGLSHPASHGPRGLSKCGAVLSRHPSSPSASWGFHGSMVLWCWIMYPKII
jgi:hypothetical protein